MHVTVCVCVNAVHHAETIIIFACMRFIVVDCGQPMDEVADPQRMVMPPDVTTFNTTRSYSCATGYNLVGSDMRTCQQDSTWSGVPPSCEGERRLEYTTVYHVTNT